MTNTFEIYTDKNGQKYKIYPTLQWFDKKNELIVGDEKIKTIDFAKLVNKIEKKLNIQLESPITGAFDITETEDYGIKNHITHRIDHARHFYTLSFDEVEIFDNN